MAMRKVSRVVGVLVLALALVASFLHFQKPRVEQHEAAASLAKAAQREVLAPQDSGPSYAGKGSVGVDLQEPGIVSEKGKACPCGMAANADSKSTSKGTKPLPPLLGEAQPTPEEAEIIRTSFEPFEAWAKNFVELEGKEQTPQSIQLGKQQAQARRDALKSMIRSNPQLALQKALPYLLRKDLPAEVAGLLEERVSAKGKLGVLAIADDHSGQAAIRRIAEVSGKEYEAFVYGRRVDQPTRENISLQGIALDGIVAVGESPVRALDPGEPPSANKKRAAENCPVSGQAVEVSAAGLAASAQAVTAESGDTVYYLCSGGHIIQLGDQVTAQESSDPPIAASAWTTGTKTVIFIRVNYPDDLTDPQSQASSQSMMDAASAFFTENSYGLTAWTTTVTPLLTLPNPKAYYAGSAGDSKIMSDARTVATANGYNYLNYNLDATRFQGAGGSYGGMAYVGGRGVWLKSSSVGVAAHEFGHNYGLWHANYWIPSTESPIGPGSHQEYGDSYDTMGAAGAGAQHFNAYEKNLLGWIPPANVTTITASGTYRTYAFDQTFSSAQMYGLKVKKDADRDYWIAFRQKFTSNVWMMNGADLHWDPWASSASGSHLLDTTVNSPYGKSDSAVVIGRTFSDPSAGIHITPIGKGGTTPESLDVVVNIGSFSGNLPPTLTVGASATAVAANAVVNFTATASDPNGDAMSYYWDFGDGSFGTNSATVSKSWATAKEYLVQCTVSDRKGGIATDSIIITVGSPTSFRISGRVTKGGQPVLGARVSVSSTQMTYTDSDGTYNLVGLAAGSYTVSAAKYDHVITASFTNPVTVGPSATGKDFTATQTTYTISGTITSGGTAAQGVTVSDGTRSASTDASGNYTLSGVPSGLYTLTATKGTSTYNPSGWTNPLAVDGANVTGKNFIEAVYTISGSITGLASTNVVTVTDGVRSTTSFQQGTSKNFTLTNVPNGTWNLTATFAGSTITPSNFTNPVTVSGVNLTSKNFNAVTGTTYTISGTVTVSGGAGLQGAVVSDGTRSSTTDSLGKYIIVNVPNGSYTLTPSKSGYTFSPTTLAVTVASANLTGKNFTASVPNQAPVIQSAAWANPNPVILPNTTSANVVASDPDSGPNALTYTWSLVSGPSGGTAGFAPNATTGSATSTTTFNLPGTYVLKVTVSDGVASVTSTVSVTVLAKKKKGDFDGDGKTDILLRHPTSGAVQVWLMK